MKKSNNELDSNEYENLELAQRYLDEVTQIGLWESEKYIFKRFIKPEDKILDIGCGAGRTTFNLYDLGFKSLIGLDYSGAMVDMCQSYANDKGYPIEFICNDARDLSFEDGIFDVCIFSFNGLMTIPLNEERLNALRQINRVLKKDGLFIFTTHDRNDSEYIEYWENEKQKWEKGTQDDRLNEFGDLYFTNKLSNETIEGFVHVPSRTEIMDALSEACFEIIYNMQRSKICRESEAVLNRSNNCLFWVVKK